MSFQAARPGLRILAAGCAAAFSVAFMASANQGDLSVRIGHAAPLTGSIAYAGKDTENGVRLALEEANSAGVVIGGKKITFHLLSEDDQADPRHGTTVAQKLADAKVVAVVGHLTSGASIPASKIYSESGIAQISPSSTSVAYTDQGFKTTFRVVANDAQQGKVLGEFAVQRLGAKTIAVIDDRSAYGQGLADVFVKSASASGGTIVRREFTDTTKTDFTSILTSIKGKNPDLIFFGGLDPQAAPLMRQMRNLGITSRFLAGDGVQSQEFVTLGGSQVEGAYASAPGVPLEKMRDGPAFIQKYKARFNQDVGLYAPYAYDATNLLVAAMRNANSTEPSKFLEQLASIQHEGVTGRIAFDDKGDVKDGGISLYQVKGGKWEWVETIGQ